jgi:hypothetical protein
MAFCAARAPAVVNWVEYGWLASPMGTSSTRSPRLWAPTVALIGLDVPGMVEKVTIPFVGVPPLGVAVNEIVPEKLIVNDAFDVGCKYVAGTRNFGSEGASNDGADAAGVIAGNGAFN